MTQLDGQIHVILTFCNTDVVDQAYEPTQYGKIESRDDFIKVTDNAKNNDRIWMSPPHVIRAVYVTEDSNIEMVIENFGCPCDQEGVLASV